MDTIDRVGRMMYGDQYGQSLIKRDSLIFWARRSGMGEVYQMLLHNLRPFMRYGISVSREGDRIEIALHGQVIGWMERVRKYGSQYYAELREVNKALWRIIVTQKCKKLLS